MDLKISAVIHFAIVKKRSSQVVSYFTFCLKGASCHSRKKIQNIGYK